MKPLIAFDFVPPRSPSIKIGNMLRTLEADRPTL
eukprot:gene26450-biopygen16500